MVFACHFVVYVVWFVQVPCGCQRGSGAAQGLVLFMGLRVRALNAGL